MKSSCCCLSNTVIRFPIMTRDPAWNFGSLFFERPFNSLGFSLQLYLDRRTVPRRQLQLRKDTHTAAYRSFLDWNWPFHSHWTGNRRFHQSVYTTYVRKLYWCLLMCSVHCTHSFLWLENIWTETNSCSTEFNQFVQVFVNFVSGDKTKIPATV